MFRIYHRRTKYGMVIYAAYELTTEEKDKLIKRKSYGYLTVLRKKGNRYFRILEYEQGVLVFDKT